MGKPEWPATAGTVNAYVLGQGFRALPISLEHAERAGPLPLPIVHREPFDRMLIAQAVADGLTLVSRDRVMQQYPVDVLW